MQLISYYIHRLFPLITTYYSTLTFLNLLKAKLRLLKSNLKMINLVLEVLSSRLVIIGMPMGARNR